MGDERERSKRAQRGTQNPLIRLYRMPWDFGFYSARDGKIIGVCWAQGNVCYLSNMLITKSEVNQSWDQSAATFPPSLGPKYLPDIQVYGRVTYGASCWLCLPLNFSPWTIRRRLKQGWCSQRLMTMVCWRSPWALESPLKNLTEGKIRLLKRWFKKFKLLVVQGMEQKRGQWKPWAM